ncbi:putative transposase [Providencia alcalifaciens Dmel2]|nr:putative transposase [Providencia alcalifaciens Dmel2]
MEWQNRPLDAIYPIVYLDCIVLKVRQDRVVEQRDPSCHQEAQGVPDRRLSEKSGMAGNTGSVPKMDDAAEGLANGDESLYYRVR